MLHEPNKLFTKAMLNTSDFWRFKNRNTRYNRTYNIGNKWEQQKKNPIEINKDLKKFQEIRISERVFFFKFMFISFKS